MVKEDENSKRLSYIWVTRLVVYRLINYFGHDVMGYDSDTLILRNPEGLLKDLEHKNSDIIGSAGKFPWTLWHARGFTVCMGVVLFRSTSRTGKNNISSHQDFNYGSGLVRIL